MKLAKGFVKRSLWMIGAVPASILCTSAIAAAGGQLEFQQNSLPVSALNLLKNTSGTIKLVNTGTAPISHLKLTIPKQFSGMTTNCPADGSLAPAASCILHYNNINSTSSSRLQIAVNSVGANHAIKLLSVKVSTPLGNAQCWGINSLGELGNNSTTASSTPVYVHTSSSDSSPLSNVVAMAAGQLHVCAVLSSGALKCWGYNAGGQLGDGTTTNSHTPVDVSGISTGVAIAGGQKDSCALLSSGAVNCWGDNTYGQLGNSSNTNSTTPVSVTGLSSGVNAITSGLATNCALLSSGEMQCWGYNGRGAIGDNTTTNRNAPVYVHTSSSDSTPLGNVTAIAGGARHTCAVLSSGGVKCWGNNQFGQLGTGNTTNSNAPVDVSGLASSAVAIDAGTFHTCALLNTGNVQCWGYNFNGELGNNSTTNSTSPVYVQTSSTDSTPLSNVVSIVGGDSQTCALLNTGDMKCWGQNTYGQLGDGTTTDRHTPVSVASLGGTPQATLSHNFDDMNCAID